MKVWWKPAIVLAGFCVVAVAQSQVTVSPSKKAGEAFKNVTLITFKEHPDRGDSIWAFDGRSGWIKTPRGLLSQYELIGEELDGARLEAQMSFPGQIKQALTNWRVGQRRTIGDRDYVVLQGSGARGLIATLYFDPQSGLLTRLVPYGPSPVGRVPTQIDYSDYRDV